MNRRQIILLSALGTACALGLVFQVNRSIAAAEELETSATSLRLLRSESAVIKALRSLEERVSLQERPKEDVAGLVNAALDEAGIARSVLVDLRNEASDVSIGGEARGEPQYRQQSVGVSFEPIRISEFGRFLAAWREVRSIWTPTRISISQRQARGGDASDEGTFHIAVTLTALYIHEEQRQ